MICVDDPSDDCNPTKDGIDCLGFCAVPGLTSPHLWGPAQCVNPHALTLATDTELQKGDGYRLLSIADCSLLSSIPL